MRPNVNGVDATSPYYPYERVQGYGSLPRLEDVPGMIRDYLMDMPGKGYTPPDDNRYPRCALMKYLYYDDPRPLDKPLPTPEQKLSIVFDPARPDAPPTDKGYRIFSQSLVEQAQTRGQTILRIYMTTVNPVDDFQANAGVEFVFLSNSAYDGNTRSTALSRTFAMACLTQRALAGVNMGAGMVFRFNRRTLTDCRMEPINDENMNVGYRMVMALPVIGTDWDDR